MSTPRRRTRQLLTHAVVACLVAGVLALVGAAPATAASALTVNTTNDIAANAGACGDPSTTVAPSTLSLREAVCLANNLRGSVAITVPSGTYNLTSGELLVGRSTGQSVTLTGAGATRTVIRAASASRVLNLDPEIVGGVDVTISGVTITGGRDDGFGGAGIIGGSDAQSRPDTLTIADSIIASNQSNTQTPSRTNLPGGGIQFVGGSLTIDRTTISGNSAGSSPGSGVAYQGTGASSGETLTIRNSSFLGNTGTSSSALAVTNGGALDTRGTSQTQVTVTGTRFADNTLTATTSKAAGAAIRHTGGTLSVTGSTFTGNVVSGGSAPVGGAVEVAAGTASLSYNRFTGNTASSGSAIHAASATVTAERNWFGCNGAPGADGCDSVASSGTAIDASPRLVLTSTATPSTVTGPDATSTLKASLLTDSDGNAVPATNLTAFADLPVAWSAPLPTPATIDGSTSSASAPFTQGVSTVTYDSKTSGGPGSATATFDNASTKPTVTVQRPLAIDSQPTDQSVDVGDTATFTVKASGFPAPSVQWQRSTDAGATFTDIAGATSSTYSFTAAAGDNGNRYRAVVSNGNDPSLTSAAAKLAVVGPAQFTSADTATFERGSAGTFTVTTTGLPSVSTITRTGTLPDGLTFADNGDGTATIAGTPTGAAGRFPIELVAANGIDPSGQQTLTIVVEAAPAVTANPADLTVQPGDSASFTASASGTPTPTVQWQRSTDGGATFTNVAGATGATYSFTAARGDDGNRYRAVFTNARGTATTTAATLRVGTAPAFTSPKDATFFVGTKGSVTVSTSGTPAASISTTGTQLPTWLSLTDNGDGTASLAGTPPVGSGALYTFTLRAANGFSPAASQTFTLRVFEEPKITSKDATEFTAGTANSFTVTASDGYPDGVTLLQTGPLPSGVGFVDNGDGTGRLEGTPDAGTGGVYTMRFTALNSIEDDEQTFTLTVSEPPAFTSVDKTTFRAGSADSFTVTTAPGYPAAAVLTADGDLPAGVTFADNRDGTATLAGTPAKGQGGTYRLTLRADNGVGSGTVQTFTLTVVGAPTFTSDDTASFTIGTKGSFDVSTEGFPAASLTVSGALPKGLTFTDDGDGTATITGTPAPGTSGTYTLGVTAENAADTTKQTLTLTVDKAAQAVTVTSVAPTTPVVGDTYTPTAVADSGLAVAVSVDPSTTGSACSIDDGVVTFDDAGTCVIAYDQAGDDSFAAAPKVTESIAVTRTAVTLGLTTSASPSVFGQAVTATATVATATGGAVAGTVQFTVDGDALGSPVTVVDGIATSAELESAGDPLTTGSHVVGAVFTPTDAVRFFDAAGGVTQVVNQASTTTKVAVGPSSITATVTPVAPGSGTPTGTVTFSVGGEVVGSAPLVGGVARLDQTVPAGLSREVAAVYGGSASFTGSSSSINRNDPTITASVSSAHARTSYGWYRGPVTVTFTCATNGAALTEPCPAPVRLDRRGAAQSVTRTITSVDGGVATAVVGGINIDDQRPTLKIRGVKKGGVYGPKAPKARCVAKDALSGVASCKVSTRKRGTTVTVTATATDRAGNTRSTSVRYRTSIITLEGARFRDGAYDVRRGRTYTLVVHAGSRPRYYQAEVVPRTPRKPGGLMRKAGKNRYALGVTMTDLRGRTYWNLGVKIGKKMHVVRVRAKG